MSDRTWPKEYECYRSFYTEVYGGSVQDIRTAGRIESTLLTSYQGAGDWSDAPVPELCIIIVNETDDNCAEIDLGAGRFPSNTVREGVFCIVPPNTGTFIKVGCDHKILVCSLPYAALREFAGLEAGLPEDGDFGHLHSDYCDDRQVRQLVTQLWSNSTPSAGYGTLWADGITLQLAESLLRLKNGHHEHQKSGGLAPWQIKRVREYIEANYAEDVSLCNMAEFVGLSTFWFARAFKDSVGSSPHRYLRQLRCEKAQKLMMTPQASITDVAGAVGYATPQAFARMFRAETGVSPTEWRRARRS
jgi:AraC family transcriptional regulator